MAIADIFARFRLRQIYLQSNLLRFGRIWIHRYCPRTSVIWIFAPKNTFFFTDYCSVIKSPICIWRIENCIFFQRWFGLFKLQYRQKRPKMVHSASPCRVERRRIFRAKSTSPRKSLRSHPSFGIRISVEFKTGRFEKSFGFWFDDFWRFYW